MLEANEATVSSSSGRARQRVRVTFARSENTRYVGHLDMVRTWERIIRRAGLPMAYSDGYNPRPRLAFAAALPVGCTSDEEVFDMILWQPCELSDVHTRLARVVPAGIRVISVKEESYATPALQTRTRATEFVATLRDDETRDSVAARMKTLLESPSLERTRRGKRYDLRPLILDLWIESTDGDCVHVAMLLKAEESGTGRPDEVVAAMGLDPVTAGIHRRRLILA